jgi:hypothetical protein
VVRRNDEAAPAIVEICKGILDLSDGGDLVQAKHETRELDTRCSNAWAFEKKFTIGQFHDEPVAKIR